MAAWHGDPREFQAPTACIVDFPSRFPTHPSPICGGGLPQHDHVTTTNRVMLGSPRLSDEDVDRIAKRVAELTKAGA